MKIVFDGIIERLQANGGCTVYFKELLSNLDAEHNDVLYLDYSYSKGAIVTDLSEDIKVSLVDSTRFAERWRDVDLGNISTNSIFHSTHYRLAEQNVKTVTTVHDFTYELYRKGPAKWMHSWQKFRAIRNSHFVICVSQNTANDLMRFCPIDPSKIRVVYNGVSNNYYPLEDTAHTNEVVFIGARGWYKNFTLAVQTLKYQPDLTLSIVGGGELSDKELQLLEATIPGRYEWLGRLSEMQLNKLYNRAHCLFYPSSYEGFGIPIIEAMRSGCPVIAVNVSSIPEVAGTAAILTQKADVESFNKAFAILNSKQMRSDVIQKGFQQAARFSWEKCYQDTLAVYEELDAITL